ncbi:15120_t:CDS:1, partial [Gigaspora margarita]
QQISDSESDQTSCSHTQDYEKYKEKKKYKEKCRREERNEREKKDNFIKHLII